MEKFNFERKDAAKAGCMSLPTLDALLRREENPIPHFKIGKKILIPVEPFRQWLADECERQAQNGRAV